MLYCADYYSPHLLGDSFLRLKLIYCGRIMGSSNHREPAGTSLSATASSLLRAQRTNTLPPHLSTQSTNGVFKTRAGLDDSWCVCGVKNTKGRRARATVLGLYIEVRSPARDQVQL